MKEKTVCFTGHRPEKLPPYGDPLLGLIKSMLYYQIRLAIGQGYTYFVSGVARGIDLWAAEYVLNIQNEFPDIRLVCAKPFPSHGEDFRGEELYAYKNILSKAHEVVCVSDEYSRDCYKARNYYMVDRSSKLIAVVCNHRSGTGQTISYAKKSGLETAIIDLTGGSGN